MFAWLLRGFAWCLRGFPSFSFVGHSQTLVGNAHSLHPHTQAQPHLNIEHTRAQTHTDRHTLEFVRGAVFSCFPLLFRYFSVTVRYLHGQVLCVQQYQLQVAEHGEEGRADFVRDERQEPTRCDS